MRPLMSWIVAKLALPMTRLSIMRPATATTTCFGSISSFDFPSHALCRSAARCSRVKSLGKAAPRFLSSESLARRSAMIWFSSSLFVILSAAKNLLLCLRCTTLRRDLPRSGYWTRSEQFSLFEESLHLFLAFDSSRHIRCFFEMHQPIDLVHFGESIGEFLLVFVNTTLQVTVLNTLLQTRGDEIVEVAVEHPLRVAFLDAGAQVLDARLVEHVAANLVPPLDVGLRGLELVAVGLELAQFQLVQARFQHRHGFRAVAVLRAIILALYHDASGQMRDAHRRVGLVDVLTARAGCAVGVDAQIGGIHFHLDVLVHLGIDENAREGSVAARVRIERRLAHQAVHAVLGAQVPVRVAAADLERGALDAGDLARGLLEHLHAVALAVAVLGVHALQHLRPILRLGAAGARLDVHEADAGA